MIVFRAIPLEGEACKLLIGVHLGAAGNNTVFSAQPGGAGRGPETGAQNPPT